jgi:hypothetical protein
MSSTVLFERPTFAEIVAAFRRAFPVAGEPEVILTPDSIHNYIAKGGVELLWQRVPGWESYEWGHSDILDEEFVRLLFSPRQPSDDESIIVVTHECFYDSEQRGFTFRFRDLLAFAREIYPQIVSRQMDFFQPADTIFIAEQSGILTLLHHEGQKTQFCR